MLLEARKLEKLSVNKIERILGVDGTIYKALKAEDYIPDPELSSDIVRKFGIRQAWWDKEWETGTLDMFEKNPTPVPNSEQPTITEEQKLIATLERAVAILDRDNENLWKQNAKLLETIQILAAGKVALADKS